MEFDSMISMYYNNTTGTGTNPVDSDPDPGLDLDLEIIWIWNRSWFAICQYICDPLKALQVMSVMVVSWTV